MVTITNILSMWEEQKIINANVTLLEMIVIPYQDDQVALQISSS